VATEDCLSGDDAQRISSQHPFDVIAQGVSTSVHGVKRKHMRHIRPYNK
jgi:hypothetical protein